MTMQMISPRSGRETFLTWTGSAFLLFGAGLVAAPFPVFGYLVRLLPWLLGASAVLLTASALRKPPPSPVRMLFACVALGAALWLGVMSQYRDRALWYLAAGLLAWSAGRVLASAFRSRPAFRGRMLAALPALLFSGLMLARPRSGFSAALTLFGVFVLAWGTVLLALPRREQ